MDLFAIFVSLVSLLKRTLKRDILVPSENLTRQDSTHETEEHGTTEADPKQGDKSRQFLIAHRAECLGLDEHGELISLFFETPRCVEEEHEELKEASRRGCYRSAFWIDI